MKIITYLFENEWIELRNQSKKIKLIIYYTIDRFWVQEI